MALLRRFGALAFAGLLASALLSGCGGSSTSTTIPATVTVFYAHSAVFNNATTLYTFGYNAFGQLGNGDKKLEAKDVAAPVPRLGKVNLAATGAVHTLAAFRNNSTVKTFGSNKYGQLGVESISTSGQGAYSKDPVTVHFPVADTKFVKDIAAGGYHSLAVVGTDAAAASGTVYAWGDNELGQLGDRSQTNSNKPVLVRIGSSGNSFLDGIVQVAAGGTHSLALTADGRVFGWGSNGGDDKDNVGNVVGGQLGINPTLADGKFRIFAGEVAGVSDVTQIAAGGSTSYALKNDGTVWAWGYNGMGQLGRGTAFVVTFIPEPVRLPAIGRVIKISAGLDHVLALLDNGEVLAWGYNSFGQLGDDTTTNRSLPVLVKGSNGTAPLSGVSDIVAIGNHSLAKVGAHWYGWGDNTYGQLGNKTDTSSLGYIMLPTLVRGL